MLAAREGYPCLTVERLLEASGVSRASFYQYFRNLDDCLWNAYRAHAERLTSEVAAAVARSEPWQLAVLNALFDTAMSRPQAAQLLMGEALAGGSSGLRERDALILRIEHTINCARASPVRIDMPTAILIGATFRFLSMKLIAGAVTEELRDELLRWALAFERGAAQPCWSARFAPAGSSQTPRPPRRSGPTRPRGTPRQRVLQATAATIRQNGYHRVTVADIVTVAGVSRRQFYNEFSSKSDAVIAAYEQGFQQVLAASVPVFFSSAQWPQRVWQSGLAFTSFLAREPSIAYLGFVECHSLGRDFAARIAETQLAFTLFLEEGYRQRPEGQSLGRASSAMTAAAIAEVGFLACRRWSVSNLRRMQPLAVYMALAPFIGADRAGSFVAGKLAIVESVTPAAA